MKRYLLAAVVIAGGAVLLPAAAWAHFAGASELARLAQPEVTQVYWVCRPSAGIDQLCGWAPPFYFPVYADRPAVRSHVLVRRRPRVVVASRVRVRRTVRASVGCSCRTRVTRKVMRVKTYRPSPIYHPFYPPPPTP